MFREWTPSQTFRIVTAIAIGAAVGVASENIVMGIGVGVAGWIAAGFAVRSSD
jgi:hypothetical protein